MTRHPGDTLSLSTAILGAAVAAAIAFLLLCLLAFFDPATSGFSRNDLIGISLRTNLPVAIFCLMSYLVASPLHRLLRLPSSRPVVELHAALATLFVFPPYAALVLIKATWSDNGMNIANTRWIGPSIPVVTYACYHLFHRLLLWNRQRHDRSIPHGENLLKKV